MSDDIPFPRFRVPREDRSLLAIPQLDTATRLAEANRYYFDASQCSLHGRSLVDLRAATRRDALAAARSFTSSLTQTDLAEADARSVVVSGHQPELFHVGVWAKNFTLAGVARRSQSVALNLIIDNDTLNGTSLRIPAGSREKLRIEHVLFDTARPSQPWEEVAIRDIELFRGFGPQVRDCMHETWGFEPLIGEAWDAAVRQAAVSNRLCDALTAMRIHVERSWGQTNLELPMSKLCETEPFHWFAAHLLMRIREFHTSYNEIVADYRSAHRLRNRMQPVPDLESEDEWLEAPFWVWHTGDLQRGRLFVRHMGGFCDLRNEKEIFARLPLADDGPLAPAVAVLRELRLRGFRLRTRALTTTLFARICLADLFIHGIGGAKYDAMTDQLCERLFSLKAPDFLTVSATLYLPFGDTFSATELQLRDLDHRLRDLTYNPDRHLDGIPAAQELIAEKQTLLAEATSLRASHQLRGRLERDQHQRLMAIHADLQPFTRNLRTEFESARAAIKSQLAANSLIRNREYSFALYPEDLVRQFLEPLSKPTSQ